MKIIIDPFDRTSIDSAVKQVQRYEKEFRAKEAEFIRRLKELGVSVATTGYAVADYDGINDVLIASTQNGPRAAVIAYGQTVGFIEFGTGVRYPEWSGSEVDYTPPKHGTYGKGKGANPKGWWFSTSPGSSRHTYGNPPAEAMLTARNAMIEQIIQIARDVWR